MAVLRKPKTMLKFDTPASWWGAMYREALPAGNGTVGAAVYGGAGTENILINRADLMWQGHVGVLQDVSEKVKDVRRLISEGQLRKAQEVLPSALIAKGYRPVLASPLPMCDLRVNMPVERVRDYNRILNMETGEITVTYRDGSTRFDRALFVSRAKDLICYEITKSGQKSIEIEFALAMHDRGDARTPQSYSKLPENVTAKYEKNYMYYSGRADDGTDYGVVARITHYGGTMEVTPDGIRVHGAERVLVLLKTFISGNREKEWKAAQQELAANKLTYEKLLKEHSVIHARLFNACELDLDASDRDSSAECMLGNAFNGGEAGEALIEKLWQYGRYLMISGAPFAGVARLPSPYGIWCGEYKAVGGAVNMAEQLSMLLSPALSCNLSDAMLGLFSYLEAVTDDLKKNALRLFDSRGILVPVYIAHTSGLIGDIDPKNLHVTHVAGLCARLFYDYYLYTTDQKFLKTRALPFMKEAALFYEEYLKLGADGKYSASPSYSPGGVVVNSAEGGKEADVAMDCSIDFDVARELLTNLINASEEFGQYRSEIAKWRDMLTRFPETQYSGDGQLREFYDTRIAETPASRSFSPLYPLYPGVGAFRDDVFMRAAALTLKKRDAAGRGQRNLTGFLTAAHLYAKLADSSSAFDNLNHIVRYCMMNNLVTVKNDWRGMCAGADDAWAAYTVEGNMGLTSLITEMLISSEEDVIKLHPAVPDGWRKGSYAGMRTRAGVEVDFEWDKRKGSGTLKLRAIKQTALALVFPEGTKRVKGPDSENFNSETRRLPLTLPAGKTLSYELKF